MELIFVYSIIAYSITNVLVFGSIFKSWRDFWDKKSPEFFGKLFSCPMCLSVWVGFALSLLFQHFNIGTPMSEVGMSLPINYGAVVLLAKVFLDGVFVGGICWLIHTLQEALESLAS